MNPLPCPFCGSSKLENFDGGYLKCINCQAMGPTSGPSWDCNNVGRWNSRAPDQPSMHWQKGIGHRTWCGVEPQELAACWLTLNLNAVTCVQCLRAANLWAAEQLKKLDAPERFSDQAINAPAARSTENPRSGTSVQCGPLTLNIPPGYICTPDGRTLNVRDPNGESAWELVQLSLSGGSTPAFSFTT